jgi:hypothetical protein
VLERRYRSARPIKEIKMVATASQQAAIDKSRRLDPELARVVREGAGRYLVLGEHDWYSVTVSRDGYRCDCPAGRHGEAACWHRASAYRYRLAGRSLKAAPAPLAKAA